MDKLRLGFGCGQGRVYPHPPQLQVYIQTPEVGEEADE